MKYFFHHMIGQINKKCLTKKQFVLFNVDIVLGSKKNLILDKNVND